MIFDTLFSSVGSITKRFRIHNENDKAIQIERITLGRGNQSEYNIVINGEKGKSIEDEVIFGNDSLLVLVDVLIDPADQNLPFLVKDSVVVTYNNQSEDVKLVAWGQDAIFINNEEIPCDATWTKDKPYVIYDSAWVSQGCALTIEAGTKIYIDNDAFLTIAGSIDIRGTADEKVEISNTRLDQKYDIAPGQWGSLFFFPGSTGNQIDHTIIRNGTNGIILAINLANGEGAQIDISNTSIQHMAESGIAAYAGEISASNLEVFHCKNQLVAGFAGGNYSFQHCTFSNVPNFFTREGASVGFTNFLEFSDGSSFNNDLNLSLVNSIVWGSEDEELALDLSAPTSDDIEINRNIIRSNDEQWIVLGNFVSQEDNYPGFYSIDSFIFQIDSLSNARDSAIVSTITHDLLGTDRDEMPDIGAFERKDSIP